MKSEIDSDTGKAPKSQQRQMRKFGVRTQDSMLKQNLRGLPAPRSLRDLMAVSVSSQNDGGSYRGWVGSAFCGETAYCSCTLYPHTHTASSCRSSTSTSNLNVVGLKSPAQNHEQTRQVSAVDVASSLFRVPHSEQVNTPSSALGCASASMLSLASELCVNSFVNGGGHGKPLSSRRLRLGPGGPTHELRLSLRLRLRVVSES